jgi:hypothetical protein
VVNSYPSTRRHIPEDLIPQKSWVFGKRVLCGILDLSSQKNKEAEGNNEVICYVQQ